MLALLWQMSTNQPEGSATSFLLFVSVLGTMAIMLYIFAPTPVESVETKTRLAFLYERKDQVYENLRDLSFEHKAGKLSDGDYNSMREAMELDAAGILAEIDRLERAGLQPAPRGAR